MASKVISSAFDQAAPAAPATPAATGKPGPTRIFQSEGGAEPLPQKIVGLKDQSPRAIISARVKSGEKGGGFGAAGANPFVPIKPIGYDRTVEFTSDGLPQVILTAIYPKPKPPEPEPKPKERFGGRL